MVNTITYTPILKCRAAERAALGELTDNQKGRVIPLFEFIRPPELTDKEKRERKPTPEERLINIQSKSFPNEIALNWNDGRLFYVDFSLLYPKDVQLEFSKLFCDNAMKLYLNFTPVINLSADEDDYFNFMINLSKEHSDSRICIRIANSEINKIDTLNHDLSKLINGNEYSKQSVSLLVDLKNNTEIEAYKTAVKNIQEIEDINDFKDVILAGGAFPEDMTRYKLDESYGSQDRDDWINWNASISKTLLRIPSYGDYTIRHPKHNESLVRLSPSTTIKYTLLDNWRIFRGKKDKYIYYLANASLLREQDEFKMFGVNFSAGNKYIDEKGKYFPEYMEKKNSGKPAKGTGNNTDWLCAGINHHIAVVVDQLARLHD